MIHGADPHARGKQDFGRRSRPEMRFGCSVRSGRCSTSKSAFRSPIHERSGLIIMHATGLRRSDLQIVCCILPSCLSRLPRELFGLHPNPSHNARKGSYALPNQTRGLYPHGGSLPDLCRISMGPGFPGTTQRFRWQTIAPAGCSRQRYPPRLARGTEANGRNPGPMEMRHRSGREPP